VKCQYESFGLRATNRCNKLGPTYIPLHGFVYEATCLRSLGRKQPHAARPLLSARGQGPLVLGTNSTNGL